MRTFSMEIAIVMIVLWYFIWKRICNVENNSLCKCLWTLSGPGSEKCVAPAQIWQQYVLGFFFCFDCCKDRAWKESVTFGSCTRCRPFLQHFLKIDCIFEYHLRSGVTWVPVDKDFHWEYSRPLWQEKIQGLLGKEEMLLLCLMLTFNHGLWKWQYHYQRLNMGCLSFKTETQQMYQLNQAIMPNIKAKYVMQLIPYFIC